MPTSTARGVDIVSTGTFAASTGVTTVTRDDLAAMLAAAADPVVGDGPLKLGHRSDLNGPGGSALQPGESLGDGAPAYGWVRPTAIRDNPDGTATLTGDLLGMPAALTGDALTSGYRRRSAEIAWGITTPSGHKYAAAITGLALLGSTAPAIRSLADVAALYSAALAGQVERTTSLAVGSIDPQLEADLEAVAGLDPVRANRLRSALARDTFTIPTTTPGTDDASPVGTLTSPTPPRGETTVTVPTDDSIRTGLGFAADADIDAELRRILATRTAGTTPAVAEATATPSTEAVIAPATQTTIPELATLSAGAFADLQRDAAAGRTALAALDTARREAVLTGAITSGRIAPAERATWAAALESSEAQVTAIITGMVPRFSTTTSALGSAAAPDTDDAATTKALDDWEAGA